MKYQDKTKQEWMDYYKNMIYQEVLAILLLRMIPGAQFTIDGAEPDNYNNLKMVNKPSRKQFKEELDSYIAEEKLKVLEIFKKMEDVKAIEDRVDAIQYPAEILWEVLNKSNVIYIQDYLKELKTTRNITLIEELEQNQAKAIEFVNNKKKREERYAAGHIAKKTCDLTYILYLGWQDQLKLTEKQEDDMDEQYAPFIKALKNYKIKKAKNILKDITPAENMVLLKRELMNELDRVVKVVG